MLKNNGYTVEKHSVATDDDYILELHRIPKSREGKSPSRNYPVLLAHCLLGSSADWVIAGRERSLRESCINNFIAFTYYHIRTIDIFVRNNSYATSR